MSREYTLKIELHLLTETDISSLISHCEHYAKEINPENESELVDLFKQNIETSIGLTNELFNDIIQTKPQVEQTVEEVTGYLNEFKSKEVECRETLDGLRGKLTELDAALQDIIQRVNQGAFKIDEKLTVSTNKVWEFYNELDEIKKNMEAMSFIRDMMEVNKRVITGGHLTVIGKDDLNNPEVKQSIKLG